MQTTHKKVLLAVNNKTLKEWFEKNLSLQNFDVVSSNMTTITNDILKNHPDLILLEGSSSGFDALDLCYEIKNHSLTQDSQVIILSDREDEYIEAAAFAAGTNDYIIRPLDRPHALIGKIKSLLKKNVHSNPTIIQENGGDRLRIDQVSFTVYLNDKPVNVTKKEFDLLSLLASKPEKLFSRVEIYQTIWNTNNISGRTVDVHIRRLRIKIGEKFITTQKGVGYKFSVNALAEQE